MIMNWFPATGGVFLGWSLGANDAANVFGTAVASKMVRYATAAVLAAIFIIAGSVIGGHRGLVTISSIASQNIRSAFLVTTVAAATVTAMTYLKLPVSTSQAVMGAIMGAALGGGVMVEKRVLYKVIICWVGTPAGAAAASFLLYPTLAAVMRVMRLNLVTRSIFIRTGLIIAGCYGAYALGANNVANTTGVFYGAGLFGVCGTRESLFAASVLGGASIALGVLTYSRGVMTTVGSHLVPLDGFSALIATLAAAAAVHSYALLGVPVSTSQAVVGGILGIGLFKGIKTVNARTLKRILFGWVATPLIPAAVCFFIARSLI